MSAIQSQARPAARTNRATQPSPIALPRQIQIVTSRAQRQARPKLAYAILAIASVFTIFAAQLLISVVLSDGAFQIEKLQEQQKSLFRTQDALSEKLNIYSSTQNLAAQAANLGMVPNATPFTMDLSDGSVYASPGTADPNGCGGACNLISNSLTSGLPMVGATAPGTSPAAPSGNEPPLSSLDTVSNTEPAPGTDDVLPAPKTH